MVDLHGWTMLLGHRWARLTGWPVAMVAGGPVELGGLQPYIYCEAVWCALSRVDQDARLQVDQ